MIIRFMDSKQLGACNSFQPSFQSDPYGRVPQSTVYTSHLDPAMHRPMTVIERDRLVFVLCFKYWK